MKWILQIVTAVFATLAAILWFLSACVKLPREFPINVLSTHSMAEQIIGAQVISVGSSEELDKLGKAIIKQSRLSAAGAFFAGLAAACQTAVLFLPDYP
jgi:hypothetical protein